MIDDLLGILTLAFNGNPAAIIITLIGVTAVVTPIALVVWSQRRRVK